MQENKMGVMPVGKLIISMSLPIMASMLVQALYNIIDSIFVAQISENALTAVSMAFPIQNLMIAVATGTGVGVNALMARALGAKDQEKVNKIANNAVLLAIASYLIFFLIGMFAIDVFYRSQTDIEEIISHGKSYTVICCVFSFGIFIQIFFERMLQATGKTIYSMITQGAGAIVNIIMDPILIFGLFGMPKMGVAGAAAATVIGQIAAGILAVLLNVRKNHEVHFCLRGFRPDLGIIRQIYGIGIPSIIMASIGSVMNYGMNRILIGFTSTAAAVFGVYFKLQSFIFMPVFGLNNGVIPIIAYNYGAENRERVLKTVKLSITFAVSIMLVGLTVFQTMPAMLLELFHASETMLALGIPALRIISISYIFAGFCIACGSVFQALGHAVYSMFVSVARQLLVLIPLAYLFSRLGDVNLVWWAFPIAEVASLAVSAVCMVRLNRRVISVIGVRS
ncbi:MAG: MATE family efflux transporter [Lachnospiraceae bacterium]